MNTSLSSLHCYSGKMSQGREVAHLRVINNSHVAITGITRRKIRMAQGGGGNHRAQKDWGRREKQQDPAQETDEWREAE